MPIPPTPKFGFTLAELLICLAILGVIAVFTIPKVLQSQQDGKYKSIAKETMGTITQAYSIYKLKNGPNASLGPPNLMPYLNYVRSETSGQIDHSYGNTFKPCDASNPCI